MDASIAELMEISRNDPSITLEDEWRLYRPIVAPEDIREIGSLRTFDRALDEVTQLQRNLKMKAAWIDWMSCLQTTPLWSRASNQPLPLADDSYLGIWINNMDQETIDWFLAHRIPCFVVHRLREGELELLSDTGFERTEPTFVRGSPIENRYRPYNRMDDFLNRQNVVITHSDADDSVRREEPSEPLSALAASFS
jgi:hypothetical protein